MTTIEAQDEVFATVLSVWNGISSNAKIQFPGSTITPNEDEVRARCSWMVVNSEQIGVGRDCEGRSLFQEVALFVCEIAAPKSTAGSMRLIDLYGQAIKDAFRSSKSSGDLWFKNQRSTQLYDNQTMNQVKVFVNCVYKTLV